MSDQVPDLKAEIERSRALLRRLRDEVRLHGHLLGMDARDAFHRIEKDAEKLGQQVSEQTRRKLGELIADLRKLATAIKDAHPSSDR